jgi:small-conductance mechanosensitive channel
VVRFASFGESAVQMNVVLRSRTAADRFLLISELLRRLHVRYQAEGIDVPFPQRVVRTIVEAGGAAAEAEG